jgi:hypothetical protein
MLFMIRILHPLQVRFDSAPSILYLIDNESANVPYKYDRH